MNDGNGTMKDYDWFLLDFQYTHLSTHDNLDLTRGVMFDINAELTFYEYMESKFYGILGFKHDTWKWKAYGGDFIYSTFFLYDTVGSFDDDELVITYEQDYYTPYIGIGFSSALSVTPITFSGRLIGSVLVSGEDKDQHHLRNLVFEEEFDSGTMFAFDLGGAYNFTDNFSLQVSYSYQKYEEMKGETTITDITTGEVMEFTGDVAGMDQYSNMISLTAHYSF
jgi:plasminogen activator